MKHIVPFLLLLLLGSCVTTSRTTYLRSGVPGGEVTNVQPEPYRVQVNDNLYVRIVTPDPKWAEMFNIVPVTGFSMAGSEQSADLYSYSVQADGTIFIPYLGEVPVAGKTIPEVRETLQQTLSTYLSDAAVTVKLVNNYISLLGDVKQPGRYPIYKEHMTIFQALALAGDLDEYSDRRTVQILRQNNNTTTVAEFDLTKKDILTSEYYYVLPNDVIYARPIKGKFFKMNAFPYSVILSTVTTFLLVLNYIK